MSDEQSIYDENMFSENSNSDDNFSGSSYSEMNSSGDYLGTMPTPGSSKHRKLDTLLLTRISNSPTDQINSY